MSKFRQKNRETINGYINHMINHFTQLEHGDENFEIAQKFIWAKLDNNNFPDPDEHAIQREMKKIQEKFVIHSQDDRAKRLKYLTEEFKNRKTFKQIGISDTNMGIMKLLMCLSVNPTGAGGIDDEADPTMLGTRFTNYGIGGVHDSLPEPMTKIYPNRDDFERQKQEHQEKLRFEIENSIELRNVKAMKKQWERELEEEEGEDSFSSLEESDEEQQQEQQPASEDEEMDYEMKIFGRRKKKNKGFKRAFNGQSNLFGGLPGKDDFKMPMIRSNQPPGRSSLAPKKFTLNDFLDQQLQDSTQKQQTSDNIPDDVLDLHDQIADQYSLKKMLNIRTFDEIQDVLSQRLHSQIKRNPLLLEHGASEVFPNRSSLKEPQNLQRDLNKALNPYDFANKSSSLLTTERTLVLHVLQMLQQPSLESETFVRDPKQLRVLFKLRHDAPGFNSMVQVSHLSQGGLKNVLLKFLEMGNELQRAQFLFRGIQVNSEKLSTVIQSLIFVFNKILDRFNVEVNDLMQILLLQAGQISKSQINLGPPNLSRVRILYANYEKDPLTLMKLEQLLDQKGLFSKVKALRDVIENGILDFVAHNYKQKTQNEEDMFFDKFNRFKEEDENPLKDFLLLANVPQKKDDDVSQSQNGQQDDAQFMSLTEGVQNQQQIPCASLNFEFIKHADRGTYLLNYLYVQIREVQLLIDSLQSAGNEKLNTLKECFLTCLKPYLQILNDWVCKGDDDLKTHDLKNEFFIKANHHLFSDGGDQNQQRADSRKQWSDSYVFRTINISQLMGQAMGEFGNMLEEDDGPQDDIGEEDKKQKKEQIEISCPIFLRPLMKEILSVGKTIKVIRFLENNQININQRQRNTRAKGIENLEKMNNVVAQQAEPEGPNDIKQKLDHQGIFYDKLRQKNVNIIQLSIEQLNSELYQMDKDRASMKPLEMMNTARDRPSCAVEMISNNLIHSQTQQQQQSLDAEIQKNPENYVSKQAKILQEHQQNLRAAPFQTTFQPQPQPGQELEDEEMQHDDFKGQLTKENNQLFGLFNLPGVIRTYEANQFNFEYHQELNRDTKNQHLIFQNQQKIQDKLTNEGSSSTKSDENSPKQNKLLAIQQDGEQILDSSAQEAQQVLFGNKKPASSMFIGNSEQKINNLSQQHFFNFSQQELSLYQYSMAQYQSSEVFEYYLKDDIKSDSNAKAADQGKIQFKNLTVESYIKDTILEPISQIFSNTSHQFLNHYLMREGPEYCQLQDQLSLLHKVYFHQGIAMHQFLKTFFDKLDRQGESLSSFTSQIYLVNGNFQECLMELLDKSLPNLDKIQVMSNMNISFEQYNTQGKFIVRSASDCLQCIRLSYNCEWPVEIVIDKNTILRNYNRVFKLLTRVRYAKYLMEKKDFHIKEPNLLKTTSSYTYSKNYKKKIEEMSALERVVLENKVFQRELLHLIQTLDDYFMTRATSMESDKFMKELMITKLGGPQQEKQASVAITQVKDLDDIIEMHDQYLRRIMQLCLLDEKSQELLKLIVQIVDISQEFRKLVKTFLLDSDINDNDSDDSKPSFLNNSFDSDTNREKTRSKKIEDHFKGMGQLHFSSDNFAHILSECQEKLNGLRSQFENHMLVLTTMLNKLTKTHSGKIILSYLLEMLQRLNFNSYYISREDENLPPVGQY